MQVLGSLIKLGTVHSALPVPWWHRSPLGLLHGTRVYVALVKSAKRPVGDLILSVLDPARWGQMVRVDFEKADEPGVLASAFASAKPLNIAIAETVTVETGDKHQGSLVCEPVDQEAVVDIDAMRSRFETSGFTSNVRIEPFLRSLPPILWQAVTVLDHGWARDIDWSDQILEQYPDSLAHVDLRKVVVSADTEKRILRYVFPYKGAYTIWIEHADRPGALKALADVLAECRANVLSALLRRGGAKPGNAVLVAVCEPSPRDNHGEDDVDAAKEEITRRIKRLPSYLRLRLRVFDGDDAEDRIYPRHPEELVARVPRYIRPMVQEFARELPKGKIWVFLSRRFVAGERRTRIVDRVRKVLIDNGCFPVEALPEFGEFATSIVQVAAKMWLSKAGIVLVAGGEVGDDQRAFSMNLAHEYGFLQGQGKPVLLLVEDGCGEEMREWTNTLGIVAPRFAKDEKAFNPDASDSLDAILSKWISRLKRPATSD